LLLNGKTSAFVTAMHIEINPDAIELEACPLNKRKTEALMSRHNNKKVHM
jgi:hypothetical protein